MTAPAWNCQADVRFSEHCPGVPTRVQLRAALSYRSPTVGTITIPERWVSDGGSIPRVAWSLIGHPFDDRWLRSALLHDLLCAFHVGTWQEATRLFGEAMQSEGNTGWRRPAMTGAVYLRGPRWRPAESITLAQLEEIVRTREFTWDVNDRRP